MMEKHGIPVYGNLVDRLYFFVYLFVAYGINSEKPLFKSQL